MQRIFYTNIQPNCSLKCKIDVIFAWPVTHSPILYIGGLQTCFPISRVGIGHKSVSSGALAVRPVLGARRPVWSFEPAWTPGRSANMSSENTACAAGYCRGPTAGTDSFPDERRQTRLLSCVLRARSWAALKTYGEGSHGKAGQRVTKCQDGCSSKWGSYQIQGKYVYTYAYQVNTVFICQFD